MRLLDKAIKGAFELGVALIELLDDAWEWLSEHLGDSFTDNDDLRRIYIVSNFLLAIVKGTIKDDIANFKKTSGADRLVACWWCCAPRSPASLSATDAAIRSCASSCAG